MPRIVTLDRVEPCNGSGFLTQTETYATSTSPHFVIHEQFNYPQSRFILLDEEKQGRREDVEENDRKKSLASW